MGLGEVKQEAAKEFLEDAMFSENLPRIRKKKAKLSKDDILHLLKEKGPTSIDPDHQHLAEYLFPPKDTKNHRYLRRNILASWDFILAHCDLFLK
jgi:hypothetical protein